MRSGCFSFILLLTVIFTLLFVAALPGGGAFAADGTPVVSSFTFAGADSVALGANNEVTVTMPHDYAGTDIDLSGLQLSGFNISLYTLENIILAAPTADIAGGAPVSVTVQFTIRAENDPTAIYSTEYFVKAARANAVPATFTGVIEKNSTLSTTSLSFSPDDFTARYTANDGGPMTGIIITGAAASGRFQLNGAAYTPGTPIGATDIVNLRFLNQAEGTFTFSVLALNASMPGDPGIGGVTLRIMVTSPQQSLNEIFHLIKWNTYLNFDEGEFNSAFRALTGRDLYYIRISPPSASNGRLYYNYSGTSGTYESTVVQSDRFYRNTTPRISGISYVPNSNYTGSLTLYYTAFDDALKEYSGTFRIQVADDDGDSDGDNVINSYTQTNTVTYSVAVGVTAYLSSTDFNASLVSATGHQLSYIRFHALPSSSAGRLYYNMKSSSGAVTSSNSVTIDTRYYMTAAPDISSITFVPTANYYGVISIPYTANATNGSAYGGTLYIRVGQSSSTSTLGDITYTLNRNANLKLSAADFQNTFSKIVSSTLSHIIFKELPSEGSLYYNYRSPGDYDSEVTTSVRYYRVSNPIISQITFVPKSGQSGKITIPYTAYAVNGVPYDGKIIITMGAAPNLRALTYQMISGEPLYFDSAGIEADIRALVRQAAGSAASDEALSYVTFAVPKASDGTIYKNYSAGSRQRQSIAADEKFYDGANPAISSLTFVAELDSGSGSIRLTYTAYAKSGKSYEGRITIKQLVMPDSWSRDEVSSLAMRGVIPDSLLGAYDSQITRAEYTALLVKAFDYSGVAPGESTRTAAFTDTRGNPFARQISRAYSLMIIDGVSATEFDPDSPLTREAAAKILCATVARIRGVAVESSAELPYADIDEISDWALPFVSYAYEYELMIGDNTGRFLPQDSLSREEAMVLVERMIKKYDL